jgi:hypothetical protein
VQNPKKEITIFEYFLFGFASLVPILGFFVVFFSIIFGIVKYRIGGWKLILMGVAGILLTHYLFPIVLARDTEQHLHRCVADIEFYKQVHGHYPNAIEDLLEGKKGFDDDRFLIRDESQRVGFFKKCPPYFYQLMPDGKGYYLLSVGPDGQPFTADDRYPGLTSEEEKNSGFHKKINLESNPLKSQN